eukprot:5363240-Pyramimonas_sp.AAC.1
MLSWTYNLLRHGVLGRPSRDSVGHQLPTNSVNAGNPTMHWSPHLDAAQLDIACLSSGTIRGARATQRSQILEMLYAFHPPEADRCQPSCPHTHLGGRPQRVHGRLGEA